MWCVKTTTAYPDYKSPCATCSVFFTETKEEAKKLAREKELDFLRDQFEYEETDPVTGEVFFSMKKDPQKGDIFYLKDLDSKRFVDWYYSDSYMDMSPFKAEVVEVTLCTKKSRLRSKR